MPGVAQVWLTMDELHALVQASTRKNVALSPRMEAAILPKLEQARGLLGCPAPFGVRDWPPAEPLHGGY